MSNRTGPLLPTFAVRLVDPDVRFGRQEDGEGFVTLEESEKPVMVGAAFSCPDGPVG